MYMMIREETERDRDPICRSVHRIRRLCYHFFSKRRWVAVKTCHSSLELEDALKAKKKIKNGQKELIIKRTREEQN